MEVLVLAKWANSTGISYFLLNMRLKRARLRLIAINNTYSSGGAFSVALGVAGPACEAEGASDNGKTEFHFTYLKFD